MSPTDRPVMRDIALVILRLILGIILICYSWDKIFITDVDKTTGYFAAANTPRAHLTVQAVILVELVGGVLLILGLLASTVAMVFIVEMINAWWSMHLGNSLFIRDNGAEFVMLLIGGLMTILVFGAGHFSLGRQFIR